MEQNEYAYVEYDLNCGNNTPRESILSGRTALHASPVSPASLGPCTPRLTRPRALLALVRALIHLAHLGRGRQGRDAPAPMAIPPRTVGRKGRNTPPQFLTR